MITPEPKKVDKSKLGYRPCVGLMILNSSKEVFVGQRFDSEFDAWQMPQGGIDSGESPWEAALRELGEETGIAPGLVERAAESKSWLEYDIPDHLISVLWGGKYRGQRQKWYALNFLGEDSDINILTEIPEFRAWRWASPDEVPGLIVPFKRQLYTDLVSEFRQTLKF